MKPNFADFLKQAHQVIHVPEAAHDTTSVFDIGYALGKLTAHYKRKMTDIESDEFDQGVMLGYSIGHAGLLQ